MRHGNGAVGCQDVLCSGLGGLGSEKNRGVEMGRGKQMQEHSLVPVGLVYCGPQGSSNSVGRLLDQGTEAGSRAGSTCPSPPPQAIVPSVI